MSDHSPAPEIMESLLAAARVACLYQTEGAQGWLASPFFCQTIGQAAVWTPLDREQVAGLVHADDADALDELLQERRQEGALRLRSGASRWPWFTVRSLREGGGRVLVFSDTSEARQMEAAVLDSQIRLHSIYNAAPVAIILWSREGRITDWNRMAETMFGYTADEVLYSKLVPKLIAPDDYESFSANITRLMRGEPPEPVVCQTLTKDGKVLKCAWRNVTLRNVRGGLVGIMSLADDVTAELAAEAALRKSIEVSEELGRSKSQFIALASHELRTPLNGVLGMAELLESASLGEEERVFLGELQSSAKQMKAVIDGILSYTAAYAESDPSRYQTFMLVEMIVPLFETFTLAAKKRGLEFTLQMSDEDAAATCRGDMWRLERILEVLLDNAIKFTEAGQVILRARVAKGTRDTLVVEVADTGIGILDTFMPELYTPFRQAQSHVTRRHDGLGIGLAMAKRLVDAIGGRLRVQSTIGVGTTFTLEVDCGSGEVV